jgi:hypothetical protein
MILLLVPLVIIISGMQIELSNGLLTKNGICTTLHNEKLAEDLFEIDKEFQDEDYYLKNMIKDLAEENRELAEIACQNIIDDGNIGP